MKRFLVFLLAAAFVMAAGNVFAQSPAPPGSQESGTWYWDGTAWVSHGPMDPEDINGRLFRGGETISGNCNAAEWLVNVSIHASIGQWIDFELDWNRFDWFIRKPGIYAGNCIEACVASNGDIYIDYDGFADLQPDDPNVGVGTPIPVWYGLEIGTVTPLDNDALWVAAADLNEDDDLLEDSEALHYSICWKLWNKIEVIECNSACEYSDDATITLTLNNQKDWIDVDGHWWDYVPPPAP